MTGRVKLPVYPRVSVITRQVPTMANNGTMLQSKTLNRPTLDVKSIRKYCYRRPTHVDYVNADFHPPLSAQQVATLPASVDLSPKMMPCYNQLDLGSCASNATAGAVQYDLIKQGLTVFMPSRLFIYYGARVIQRTVPEDSGTTMHEAVQVLTSLGVCPESEWPYDTTQFAVKPPQCCYSDASKCKALRTKWVNQDANSVKGVLASGLPVLIGIVAYQSLESPAVAKTGMIPMPQKGEQMIGGHAILIVGYDDTLQCFKIRNSWGEGWALNGYGWLPYAYALNSNLAAELCTISSVS